MSARTGKRLSGKQIYPPMDHVRSNHCSQTTNSRDDFRILGRERNQYLLKIKESLFIHKYRPSLNGNDGSLKLDLFD